MLYKTNFNKQWFRVAVRVDNAGETLNLTILESIVFKKSPLDLPGNAKSVRLVQEQHYEGKCSEGTNASQKRTNFEGGVPKHTREMTTPSSSQYKHITACFPASLVLK